MATIFHLALAGDWAAAQAGGAYTTSTRGRSLAEVGFIHASRADQWTGVRERHYGDVTEPMVLLQIDTALLDVPVLDEPAAPGATETFPHIYGRLPVSAVTRAIPLAAGTAAAGGKEHPAETFSGIFLREMFANVALLLLVIVAGSIGIGLGLAVGTDAAPGIGGIIGVLLGALGAIGAHRRRRARTAA